MKRFSAMLAIGFGCVAIVAAQTTPQTSSPPQSSASKSDQTITLTGCLQRGDHAAAVGTTGTAGTSTAAGASRSQSEAGNSAQFILTNAKSGTSSETSRSAAGAPTSAGAAGTAGTSSAGAHPSATSGSSYILEGSQSELASNAGKRVEVTGTIDSSMSSSSPSAATSAVGSASASAAASPKFKVSSVKVIGSDCSNEQ